MYQLGRNAWAMAHAFEEAESRLKHKEIVGPVKQDRGLLAGGKELGSLRKMSGAGVIWC